MNQIPLHYFYNHHQHILIYAYSYINIFHTVFSETSYGSLHTAPICRISTREHLRHKRCIHALSDVSCVLAEPHKLQPVENISSADAFCLNACTTNSFDIVFIHGHYFTSYSVDTSAKIIIIP